MTDFSFQKKQVLPVANSTVTKDFVITAGIQASKISKFEQYLGTFEIVETATVSANDDQVIIQLHATDAQIQDFVLFGIYIYPEVKKIGINTL
ncbi:MAG: Unknown protein [uncultured Thiotrichaceae bacterium]|uniref:Uncharacterized protein n=1 Tax=uncultured Thiotrichaceae bacterium TaxID=298394 RepID=A0A6S6SD03_9GAMM|nr:MAG: Unknown protein [uncultured Thiotrichaceae bacterium]